MSNDIFTTGSGNVFIDLGFSEEEAAELTLKSCLFTALQQAISQVLKTSTQAEVAKHMGVDQPIISKIMNDRMSGFSVQRIAGYLLRLHYDICLTARPSPRTRSGRVIPMNTKAASNRRHVKARA
jgi:predicted XRE-type DNA-binding protein